MRKAYWKRQNTYNVIFFWIPNDVAKWKFEILFFFCKLDDFVLRSDSYFFDPLNIPEKKKVRNHSQNLHYCWHLFKFEM